MFDTSIRQECKQRAKRQISGQIGLSFLCIFVYSLIHFVIGGIPLLSILLLFLSPPLVLGLNKVYLELSYDNQPTFMLLFSGFQQFGQAFLTNLLLSFISFIYGLLIILPLYFVFLSFYFSGSYGLLILYFILAIFVSILFYCLSLGFSMVYFIMAEQPELSTIQILKASWQMMKGRRFSYFVFQLSFFPWALLCVFTFGIALIYLIPYLQVSLANYYQKIRANQTIFPILNEYSKENDPSSFVFTESPGQVNDPLVDEGCDPIAETPLRECADEEPDPFSSVFTESPVQVNDPLVDEGCDPIAETPLHEYTDEEPDPSSSVFSEELSTFTDSQSDFLFTSADSEMVSFTEPTEETPLTTIELESEPSVSSTEEFIPAVEEVPISTVSGEENMHLFSPTAPNEEILANPPLPKEIPSPTLTAENTPVNSLTEEIDSVINNAFDPFIVNQLEEDDDDWSWEKITKK